MYYWETQAAAKVLLCAVMDPGLVRLVCQAKLIGNAMKNAAQASVLLEDLWPRS